MSVKTIAVVECLDSEGHAFVSKLELPAFDGWLTWKIQRTSSTARLAKSSVVFVINAHGEPSDVANRIRRYHAADRFAIGVYVDRSASPSRFESDVVRLKHSTWRQDLRMVLVAFAAMIGEGQPESFVCLDWADVIHALNRTHGELLLEWSAQENANAFNYVFQNVTRRLAGRLCGSIICLMSGGRHPWFKELRTALKTCRSILVADGVLLGGDRIAPFCRASIRMRVARQSG